MARAAVVEISMKAGSGLHKQDSKPSTTSKEGGIATMQQNHPNGLRFATLFSPVALRIELLGIVALVLLLGRISPDFGKLLLQFSQFLFR